MRLACSSWMLQGDTFAKKAKEACRYGFEGMELRIINGDISRKELREISTALSDMKIKPTSIIMPTDAFRRPLDSEQAKEAKIDHMKFALDIAAEMGCPALVCPEFGPQIPLPLFSHPKRPIAKEYDLLYEFLNKVGEYAESVNTIALIEPINRYETHFYYTLEDALKCLEIVGHKSIMIIADLFHMSIEEDNLVEAIKKAGKHIGHIHLGDSNRFLPGQGHTDFKLVFDTLKSVEYKGFMALECAIKGNPEVEIPKCVNYLKSLID